MANYTANFLRMLRNQIPIDEVVGDLLNLELRNTADRFRFRCPLCNGFHTAINRETNLARCFDCQKNFNPIDLVMTVTNCNFLDAVDLLKDRINQ
jgi:DNA primase